jgi:DNA-directed RNA polymerase subunit RPC12/RpoP
MRDLIPSIQRQGLDAIQVSPGKSIDGRLIFDLMVNAHSNNFDTAVIASGDRDYIPVVEHVKRLSKDVKIASFSANLGQGLKDAADGNVLCLENHITTIAQTTYGYKCSQCGKDFVLVFKLYPNQLPPRCSDCYKQSRTTKSSPSPITQNIPSV